MAALSVAQEHPDVFSRFVITPTRQRAEDSGDQREPYALACGALANFSGFLAEEFRKHDFLLGRHNCQQFLRRYFTLPPENPLFDKWPDQMKNDMRYVAMRQDKKFLPIIPLVDGLDEELKQPEWPVLSQDRLDSLQKQVKQRANVVVDRLIRSHTKSFKVRMIAKAIWLYKRGTVIHKLMEMVRANLDHRRLLG